MKPPEEYKVRIETNEGLGSGIVYDRKGHIVTNAHVVGTATTFKVTFSNGRLYTGALVGSFPANDLAVIKIAASPVPALFADSSTHPKAEHFQQYFVNQVEGLATDELGEIGMNMSNEFNSGLSQASQTGETNYLASFEDGGGFAEDIEDELAAAGSELEPVDIVARAQTQSCAGCHQLSNNADLGGGLVWPASLGFVHVSEREPETVAGVTRFRISEALTGTFLPQRKQVLEDFLARRVRNDRQHGRRRFSH